MALLVTVAQSDVIDRYLSGLIRKGLARWTDLDSRDSVGLLHVGGDYQVAELQVQEGDWMAGSSLDKLRLEDEGILVLGLQKVDGRFFGVPPQDTVVRPSDTLILFGRTKQFNALDKRRQGIGGALARGEAVAEQKRVTEEQHEELEEK